MRSGTMDSVEHLKAVTGAASFVSHRLARENMSSWPRSAESKPPGHDQCPKVSVSPLLRVQGQEQGAHLADAVGHTDQGLSHAEELAHGQVHPAVAPQGAKVVEFRALAAGTGGCDWHRQCRRWPAGHRAAAQAVAPAPAAAAAAAAIPSRGGRVQGLAAFETSAAGRHFTAQVSLPRPR